MKKLKKRNLYWNLYWIESDGWEDCFVVARNSRSARCVEKDVNGFEDDDLNVTKVMRIPKNVERFYQKQPDYKKQEWPYYVYGKEFFKKLGATFRKVEEQEQMLLENTVYNVDEYASCNMHKMYSIGSKALKEINEIANMMPELYTKDDEWDKGQFSNFRGYFSQSL